MARLVFPNSGDRLVYRVSGTSLLVATATPVTIYTDSAGTLLADIQTYPGAVAVPGSVLVTDSTYGTMPEFYGPADSSDTLYARASGGPVTTLFAREDAEVSVGVAAAIAVEAAARVAADALKAPLDSPVLTGTPAAPTAAPGTNTTQAATTAFSAAAIAAQHASDLTLYSGSYVALSPQAYGVTFDGVTDDTAAWNALFTAMAVAGWSKPIKASAGTSLNNGQWTPPAGFTLDGAGVERTIIKFKNTGVALYGIRCANDMTIKNATVQCDVNGPDGVHGLCRFAGVQQCPVRQREVQGHHDKGRQLGRMDFGSQRQRRAPRQLHL